MDKARLKEYLKKLGVAGFLFFLIKGLFWLFLFFGGFKFLQDIIK